jgi:hypothetical protein
MRIFATFIVMFLLAGCSHQYKYYDFSDAQIRTDDGVINVFVRGSFRQTKLLPQTTERANPYYFVVSFETSDAPNNPVEFQVTGIGLNSVEGSWQKSTVTEPSKDRTDTSWAYMVVNDINLRHEVVVVTGKVRYKGRIHEFSASLRPEYSSEWRNNFHDALMSV